MTDQSYVPTDNIGYLRFSVGTAGNTIPVRDATVYVYTEGGGKRTLLYTLVSDEDGITSTVALPTPPLAESFLPRGPIPFSTYSIYATKEGFYPSEGRTVPLFPSITSIQPINLIPVSVSPTELPLRKEVSQNDRAKSPRHSGKHNGASRCAE